MKLIHNVFSGEHLNFEEDKAAGVAGLLFKGGQGAYPDFPRVEPNFEDRMNKSGLPWGITWQFDARISPEATKAAIKYCFPTGYFGQLGLWLCVEYPYYGPTMNEVTYWLMKYAKYTNVESIWRGVYSYTGVYPGIYTSVSKWNLIFGSYTSPDPRKASRVLQEEIASKAGLMVAQYGVTSPTKFGAWQGNYTGWQYRENPDLSYFSDTWFNKCVNAPPVPEPEPIPGPDTDQHIVESIKIVVYSPESNVNLKSVLVNGKTEVLGRSTIAVEPFPVPVVPPEPGPVDPAPVDGVVDDICYGVLRFRSISNALTNAGKFTPAVVPLQDVSKPNDGKGAAIPVRKSAWNFMQKINDAAGFKYCQSIGAMWINTPYSDPLQAHGESIDCMCNVISWKQDDVKNTCYRLISFQTSDNFDSFDPNEVNWHRHPEWFIKAQSVNLNGSSWIKVRDNVDCYIPLMARSTKDGGTGELWLDMREVEPFLELPCTVKVVEEIGLNVREKPGIENALKGSYLLGESVIILEYRPLGNMVWGRTAKGWICLRLSNGTFPTTWTLKTPRVLPPG